MPVEPLDVVRITARMLLNGVSDLVNVYHFVVVTDTTPDDLLFMTDVATVMDALYSPLNPAFNPLMTYISVEGQNITKNELLPSVAWPVLTAGAGVDELLPETTSPCVFHRTLTPRVRASKFLPPMGEAHNVNGAILASTVLALQAFGDTLTGGLSTANIFLAYVAFNRLLSISTAVTQAIVPTRWRTQRRRRIGVGS